MSNTALLRRKDGVGVRLLKGSVLTVLGFGGAQLLRLGGNLVLTRLLMPEAFGLMALITVLLTGLKLFSDIGIGQSILRSPRGDEAEFLDSAWSLDLIRGFALWGVACLLAWPMAYLYGMPELGPMIAVAGLSLVIAGFEPTRVDTAVRHMQLGRVTMFDLFSQFLGLLLTIALTWATGSVWALVVGQLASALIRLVLMTQGLPGPRNRFRLERGAVAELLSFGKWIFVSTIAGFIVSQGDRVILSSFLGLDMLGIYTIGQTLAALPLMVGSALVGRLVLPLYRDHPPAESPGNFAALRRWRFILSGGLLVLGALLALAGPELIALLYDARYQQAGAVLVLLSVALMPQLITISYDQIALSTGDSRSFFLLTAARGGLFLLCVGLGAAMAGLIGVIAGQGLAAVLSYPLVARLARRYGAWDACHDLIMGLAFTGVAVLAIWSNWNAIAALS